jgi:hypothetical protein
LIIECGGNLDNLRMLTEEVRTSPLSKLKDNDQQRLHTIDYWVVDIWFSFKIKTMKFKQD